MSEIINMHHKGLHFQQNRIETQNAQYVYFFSFVFHFPYDTSILTLRVLIVRNCSQSLTVLKWLISVLYTI